MIGIYKITSPSGNVYIGQSWQIEVRWRRHKCMDKRQPILKASMNKYGKENHKFEMLQELPKDISQEVLDNLEVFYIDRYKACNIKLLNCTSGGGSGRKGTAELKARLRTLHCKKNGKPVVTLDRQGNFIARKRSLKEMLDYLKIDRKYERSARSLLDKSGRSKVVQGYQFIYESEYDPKSNYNIGDRFKKVGKYMLDGTLINIYDTCKEAAESENLSIDNLFNLLRRTNKNEYGGFIWRYEGNIIEQLKPHPLKGKIRSEEHIRKLNEAAAKKRIPVIQYTLEGEFIKEWEGARLAAIELNLNPTNIMNCAKGKLKKTGGFQWKYKHEDRTRPQ